MKREIYKAEYKHLDFLRNPYPGEFVKVVEGSARLDMICDWSGEPINAGDKVIAITMGRGTPSVSWEQEFLKQDSNNAS